MRVAIVLCAAFLAAMVWAPAAPAATTIGGDLPVDPNLGLGCGGAPTTCTWTQRTIPGRQLKAPSDGVIVLWRFRTGMGTMAQTIRFRVIRGTGADSTAGPASDPEVIGGGAADFQFPTRISIKAGDFIGVDVSNQSTYIFKAFNGAALDYWGPKLGDNEKRASTTYGGAYQLAMNADLEADADGDGFGDESQDADDDNDGLSDADEAARGSDPLKPDTDGDGVLDPSDPEPANAGVPGTFGATNGNDSLGGDAGPNLICGLFGDDTIAGFGGNDTLFGGACNQTARIHAAQAPTDGNDALSGGDGNDLLYGAGGRDSLKGGKGNDKLFGGGDKDSLKGESGRDALDGGLGNDKLDGGKDKNSYKGGAGNDSIKARNGKKENVNCGAGSKDTATVDKDDKVKGCETVRRPR